jgi:hypothetical protein
MEKFSLPHFFCLDTKETKIQACMGAFQIYAFLLPHPALSKEEQGC